MKSIHVVNGECIFHDPGPEMIPTFLALDKGFRVESLRPGNNFIPKFQSLRKQKIYLEDSPFEYSAEALFGILNGKVTRNQGTLYSALHIYYVLCLKFLSSCSLCGWFCGVNRFAEKGKCGLASIIYAPSSFIHIAEEASINPSIVTNFSSCAMHCRYCIEHRLLKTSGLSPLDTKIFWQDAGKMVDGNTNTIEFTNPTESLHGIMDILSNAPKDFHLPVVLNCHLYGSCDFYQLADPITDVWLADLRYGNDECAKSLSGVDHYMKQAKAGLDAICKTGNRVIIRILVLPGHVSCCHAPAIELLSTYRNHIWVSILDQYVPEYEAHLDSKLSKRPTRGEIEKAENHVAKYGLRNILTVDRDFWAN